MTHNTNKRLYEKQPAVFEKPDVAGAKYQRLLDGLEKIRVEAFDKAFTGYYCGNIPNEIQRNNQSLSR